MKSLKDIILEKLVINKNTKVDTYKFKSHITDNPEEFKDNNWIIDSYDWKKNRISILIEYAKECLQLLDNKEDIDFVKSWLDRANKAYKNNYSNSFNNNSEGKEFQWLCNGEKYTFGNAKFTYDLLQYALSKNDLTIPRKQKIEKILKGYSKVEKNKDNMNWY